MQIERQKTYKLYVARLQILKEKDKYWMTNILTPSRPERPEIIFLNSTKQQKPSSRTGRFELKHEF